MSKPSPVPDELSKPFWDACNQGRLVVQICTVCNRRQHPPEAKCYVCGSAEHLEWREVKQRGTILSYCTMNDCRIRSLHEDQPFTIAVIQLEDDPEILMFSSLPGVPVDKVPLGAKVKVDFQVTPGNGQKVAEWLLVK